MVISLKRVCRCCSRNEYPTSLTTTQVENLRLKYLKREAYRAYPHGFLQARHCLRHIVQPFVHGTHEKILRTGQWRVGHWLAFCIPQRKNISDFLRPLTVQTRYGVDLAFCNRSASAHAFPNDSDYQINCLCFVYNGKTFLRSRVQN